MDKELARELISAGVHFGHAVSRWNPKMKPYIFGKRGMIHVIDVKETLKGLIVARKLVANIVASGKDVVFVGTKRQAQKSVQRAAAACGMHYVSQRWLGGTLTNFRTIRSRVQRLEELEGMLADGRMEAESKKQGSRLKRELKKITENLNGIRKMNRLPGAVVVVDVRKEYIALREARKLGVVTIGLIDTDADPDTVDVVIPGNDDSLKAIEIILYELALGCQEGKTMVKPEESSPQPHHARPRSRRRVLASATDAEPAGQEAGASAEPTETQTPQ
ncbi:MAG: 30S ribosomal protein S2 [Planctomycetes bacterium]|nr:30S ribosomal protein S2 [Planctomycetota bacterium]